MPELSPEEKALEKYARSLTELLGVREEGLEEFMRIEREHQRSAKGMQHEYQRSKETESSAMEKLQNIATTSGVPEEY